MSQQSLPPDKVLEQLFVGLSDQRSLRQGGNQAPVMFAQILHYIRGGEGIDKTHVEQAVNTDLRCRRIFQQLLTSQRVAFAPKEARADDSAPIDNRQTRAFNLKFRASKADAQQIYVILQVTAEAGLADGQKVSLLAVGNQQVKQLQFPVLQDGQTLTILLQGDDCLELLRDAETELSLV